MAVVTNGTASAKAIIPIEPGIIAINAAAVRRRAVAPVDAPPISTNPPANAVNPVPVATPSKATPAIPTRPGVINKNPKPASTKFNAPMETVPVPIAVNPNPN